MSESLEELKVIIDNAPDGAEFASVCLTSYAKFDSHGGFLQWINNKWVEVRSGNIYSRSLSDVKQIIELMEWQQSAFEAHPNIDIDIERL